MAHFVFLLSIFVAFFLVLWVLTYVFHNKSAKIVSWLIWVTSLLLLCASAFDTVIDIIYAHHTAFFGENLEGMSNAMGTLAFLWGLAAVFIFLSKRLFRRVHNKRINDRDVVRRILLLVKDHHNLFGWVTLVAATAHGIYFLFHKPDSWPEFYSGIGSWTALVLLAITGMWMGSVTKTPHRAKVMRVWHIALTVGYIGVIVLHIRASLLLGGVLIASAFAAMGLMWGIMRLIQATSRG